MISPRSQRVSFQNHKKFKSNQKPKNQFTPEFLHVLKYGFTICWITKGRRLSCSVIYFGEIVQHTRTNSLSTGIQKQEDANLILGRTIRLHNTEILQKDMEMIPIILYYNGIWRDEIVYTNFKVSGLLMQPTEVLTNLECLVRTTLNISSSNIFTMKFHITPNIPPISIRDDSTLRFYVEVCRRNSEYGKYPLIITEENTLAIESPVQFSVNMEGRLQENFRNIVNKNSAIVPLVTNSLANRIAYADKFAQDIVESEKSLPLRMISIEDQENHVISSTENVTVKEGQIYVRKDILMNAISLHSMRQNRQFKVQRSSSRDYVIVCVENTNCQWTLRASKLGNTNMFKVRKMIDVHTCSSNILMGNHRQASSELVSECIKDRFMNLKKVYTPLDIVEDMMKDYQISISYQKAWRSKERALAKVRGNPHD
ncbi:hypothetical protein OROMI_020525 [Orobanche minor]